VCVDERRKKMELKEIKAQDPRNLLRIKMEQFKGRWYLDTWLEKGIFIFGLLSALASIVYGIYRML